MRNSFYQGIGGVVSADIAVPEHAKELTFYTSILTTGDSPLWRDDLTNNQGTPIIGLGKRTPEYDSLPLQWMPHFQVSDVAASVQRAEKLGGTVLMHGIGERGESLWAGLQDPSGAAFGIIPVVNEEMYEIPNLHEVGHISSLLLVSKHDFSIQEFYEQVVTRNMFGSCADSPLDTNGHDAQVAVAELFTPDDSDTEVPALWLLTLPVNDIEESLRLVNQSGGEVVWEVQDSDIVIIRDPIGVYIALQSCDNSVQSNIP